MLKARGGRAGASPCPSPPRQHAAPRALHAHRKGGAAAEQVDTAAAAAATPPRRLQLPRGATLLRHLREATEEVREHEGDHVLVGAVGAEAVGRLEQRRDAAGQG